MNERFQTGMRIRRSILGDEHVNRADRNKTDFDAPFQSLISA